MFITSIAHFARGVKQYRKLGELSRRCNQNKEKMTGRQKKRQKEEKGKKMKMKKERIYTNNSKQSINDSMNLDKALGIRSIYKI